MRRKIYDLMKEWKEKENGTSALMIDGARRVGKSYIVEEFAKKEYKSYILIDFNKADDIIMNLFDDLTNLDIIFQLLEEIYKVKLYERESLIIFDEVELCKKARRAIKYLVADGRYDYIETGSLLSIKQNVEGIVIPSEERHLELNTFDFEEFCWALGEETICDLIRECFKKKISVGPVLHRRCMLLFRKYLIVGGMPQAILTYLTSNSFSETDKMKRNILKLYRDDVSKYAYGYEYKVKSIFDEIPSALSRHEKKFRLADIDKNARFRDYESAFFWLDDAMIVNICFNTTNPMLGLNLNRDRISLKCYMADTGLLISHAFNEKMIASNDLYVKILFDKLEVNLGMIYENVIAQMLKANGYKLHFYSNYSKINEDKMEIDFLITNNNITNRHNIIPIEVKSSNKISLTSLNKFIKKYNEQLAIPYVIYNGEFKIENNIIYIPYYMAISL